MRATDYFNFQNERFAPLREPARDVVDAAQRVNRFLDTIQEWFYIEAAMPHTSQFFHKISHEYPLIFDAFVEMLHERHLIGVYPATPELLEPITDADKAFEIAVGTLDEFQDALERFHAAADNASLRPFAIRCEDFMVQNSGFYTKILQAWAMWDKHPSATSFDNWVRELGED